MGINLQSRRLADVIKESMKKLHFTISFTLSLLTAGLAQAGLITHTDYTAGSVITSAGQNSNENTIINEFNGNINSANIAANGVATSNIADSAVVTAKVNNGAINGNKLDIETQKGWISSTMTWTYVSASTFSLSGDWTGYFAVGDKIKLTQTTLKYFYVCKSTFTGVSGITSVTITGGNDYSLANAAITSPYISRSSNPSGFPYWFNYTPVYSSAWGTVTTITGVFKVEGNQMFVRGQGTTGTVTAASGNISLPANLKIDTTSFPSAGRFLGLIQRLGSTTSALFSADRTGSLIYASTGDPTVMTHSGSAASGAYNLQNISSFYGNSELLEWSVNFPVMGY